MSRVTSQRPGRKGPVPTGREGERAGLARDPVALVLLAFGLLQLAQGVYMVVAPGSFFELVGPFGTRNDHYTRDAATFYAALGVAALVAVRRPSWRLPVLATSALQYVLHALNHLKDIGEADPRVYGPVDFALIAAGALVLLWAARRAARAGR